MRTITGTIIMDEIEQFIGQNYYNVYDTLQTIVIKYGLSTSLVEPNLDFNIDVDASRLKVYVDTNNIIIGFKQG
jgi:hypothetical protein